MVAWGRIAEYYGEQGHFESALACVRGIADPLRQAGLLETLGWRRIAAGDVEEGRAHFAQALEIADLVARGGGASARGVGRVEHAWLLLASRLQAALGDCESAGLNVSRFDDPLRHQEGWTGVGWAGARAGHLQGIEDVLERAEAPLDRIWLLLGAADGVLSRATSRKGGAGAPA